VTRNDLVGESINRKYLGTGLPNLRVSLMCTVLIVRSGWSLRSARTGSYGHRADLESMRIASSRIQPMRPLAVILNQRKDRPAKDACVVARTE